MTLFDHKYRVESTRLPSWDYSHPAWYFVTICTANREPFFGTVADGQIHLSTTGNVAHDCWIGIPDHTQGMSIDEFVVMANHIHGILVIETTPHGRAVACNGSTDNAMSRMSPKLGSLSTAIRSFESAVTCWYHSHGHPAFAWQGRSYDHIIRDQTDLARIRQCIVNNPLKWETDRDNPASFDR